MKEHVIPRELPLAFVTVYPVAIGIADGSRCIQVRESVIVDIGTARDPLRQLGAILMFS